MDMFGIEIGGVIQPGNLMLDGLTKSQQMAANNIANVNTPGYKAEHLDFTAYLDQGSSPFETELSVDMGPSMAPGLIHPGNTKVDLQGELMTAQDNMLRFNIVSSHLSKVFTRLKEATNIGR